MGFGAGGVIKKALDEACTSCLFVIIVLFCNVSYVCIFLPTKERVNKPEEKVESGA